MQLLRKIFLISLFFSFSTLQLHAVDLKKQSLKPTFQHTAISQLDLLHIDYFNTENRLSRKSQSSSDTLKILAIRVAFQQDTLATTTGDGSFILTRSDTTIIDPPPHDRTYFQAQLDAVSHYFRTVSGQKLILTGEVFPADENGSYLLPHTMDYYNPNSSKEENDQKLAELFRDAVQKADETDRLVFSNYDIFVVFHAGVGQDFSNDLDTTPDDIPSAFLNKRHLQKYLGNDSPSYMGIPTANGTVSEGIILPETENQDGSEFAVKGTFVLYLGNQLGLPDLFDSEKGRSGIGAWGLMDVGSSNYFGLIPAEPCAWAKVFLGWEEPVLLNPGTGIQIAVAKAKSAPHIFKIPINAREYFLIENRNSDFNKDKITTGRDQYEHRLEFNTTGNFTAELDTAAGEKLGVITKIFDYDFSIPGSGILIWHINDRIIEQNYAGNTVNADPQAKGVALKEADGSQDIGQSYGFLSPGSGSEFGVADDAYFADNEVHKIANKTDFVSFSPSSAPSSKSASGANTGITLNNFSGIDSVMSFDFSVATNFANFPQKFAGKTPVLFPPVVAPITGGQDKAVFFTPGNGHLFAWKADGASLIDSNVKITIPGWDGSTETVRIAVFDTIPGNFTGPPLLGDLDGDGKNEVVIAADQAKLLVFSPEKDQTTGFARLVSQINFPVQDYLIWQRQIVIAGGNNIHSVQIDGSRNWSVILNEATTLCMTKNGNNQQTLVAASRNGEFMKLSPTGQVLAQNSVSSFENAATLSLVSGYLHQQDTPVIVASHQKGLTVFDENLRLDSRFNLNFTFDTPIAMQPILVDSDHDGLNEIVLTTQNQLLAFNDNGNLVDGFPVRIANKLAAGYFTHSSPLFLNAENDAYFFFKDGVNDLFTISSAGEMLENFHLNGGGATLSPYFCLADMNNDGLIEVIDANSDGILNIRQLDFAHWQKSGSWLQTSYNSAGTKFNEISPETTQLPVNELISYAYNYPNPTEGNRTTFRFFLRRSADIIIEIYDLAGDKIDALRASGVERENEIIWSLNNVASGVYMARLRVDDGKNTDFKMIKVAVVK